MTLIGTTIGALMALVPAARRALDKTHPRFIAGYDAGLKDRRLETKQQKLARSNARLIDHIQSLERELLTERHLTQIRIEEIENLHRDLSLQRALAEHWREEAMRIAGERQRQWRQPDALAQAQQNTLAAQQAQAFQQQALGFCNCVPSRAQAWGQQHSLVSQLNREGER